MKIAWLGTGIMGAPMAAHLARAGHEVRVYNRTKSKTQLAVDAGATAYDTPREAAADADVIFVTVTDGPDVETVLFGDEGALTPSTRCGTLCIDMSTISPQVAKDLASRCAQIGVRFLDAPVTGGEVGAQKATLSIMVGGYKADYDEAMPLFEKLGKTFTYCGPHGAGQSVKLCNQICGAMNLLGICEALVLGEKMGVDLDAIIKVVGAGAGSSWAMQNLAPKIAAGDFAPAFMVDTHQKDMRLVSEAAETAGVPIFGTETVRNLLRIAQAKGWGEEGSQVLFKVLQEMSDRKA
jgi:3-hydroxyisobutyrate dehydrogenase